MAVGSKDLASEQLRGMNDDRLVDELRQAKEELFNLRFQSATGQLDNHGRLRAVRKDIARIYTEMRERELGIGTPPSAPAKSEAVSEKASEKKASDKKAEKKASDKKSEKKSSEKRAEKKAEKAEAK
jgi:large subunit ribosomal protein L29